jgi:hypothetical protein
LQRRSRLLAKLRALTLAGAALACSRSAPVARERLPDGTFSFKCDGPLSFCLSHVDEVCKGGPYTVEIGWDQPSTRGVDETRVETHRSQAIVRCLRRGENPRTRYAGPVATPVIEAEARNAELPPPAVASPAPVAKPAPRACVPGSTQACVGAAACAGGQSCLPDGSGFGPCDCGR